MLGTFCTDLIADKAVCDLNRKAFTTCYKMSSLSQLSKFRTFVGVGWGSETYYNLKWNARECLHENRGWNKLGSQETGS